MKNASQLNWINETACLFGMHGGHVQLNTSTFSLALSKCILRLLLLEELHEFLLHRHRHPPKPIKVFRYLPPAFVVPTDSFAIMLNCLRRARKRGICPYQRVNAVCDLYWVADSSSVGKDIWRLTKRLSLRRSSAGKGGLFSLLYWPAPLGHHFSPVS